MREILTRSELLLTGHSDTEIRTMLRRGTLRRLASGRYTAAQTYDALHPDLQYRLRVLAVAAATDAVVSHISAAALHRLPLVGVDLGVVHLTRPGRGGARASSSRQLHAGDLPVEHRTAVDAVAVTTVARTIVDLSRTVATRSVVVAADAALNREAVAWSEVLAAVEQARWHPGVGRAWRTLAHVDSRSESPGETLTRMVLADQGIGGLDLQVVVRDERRRFVGRTDLGVLGDGVLIEFDGKIKYGKLLEPGQTIEDVILAEKKRERGLIELGWIVIRVDWEDLRHPQQLARRVRAAYHRRPIRGTAEPTENLASSFSR